ncbi:hypothetical protein PPYR_00314 [Photinus pyralis]|uniref:Microsomal glutathione S-transferase 1 n=1 Tax=Photinus pyralis TaxID=7054 RepID=A0A1Y1NJW7_PHOPY|nr:microsomal glutathione S-transferase 1 [Photinus pyralis]XP_031328542.1 microsomal glutathione S-transferase 1 [Photinus pyralis]KAB0803344.1 hypothetical protein PPYR_00314 [Photinus pyralis]
MAQALEILSTENELFRVYLFYGCILVLKVVAMAPLTAIQRFKHKAFANPEDAVVAKIKPKTHENVERVRRAHLNDLENIPVFLVASLAYILTNPSIWFTTMLFRIFTISRILHTLVYAVVVIPQPARFLAFFAAQIVTTYMAIQSLIYFAK